MGRRTLPVVYDPHPLEAQASIGRSVCPYCADPRVFRNVAIHIAKGHGIDVEALRDAMGIPKRTAFASVETRAINAQRAIERDAVANIRKGTPGKRVLNSYGRMVQRDKALSSGSAARVKGNATWRDRDPDGYASAHRAASASVSVESRRSAGRKGGKARAAQMDAEERARMVALRESRVTPEQTAKRLEQLARGRATLAAKRGEAPGA